MAKTKKIKTVDEEKTGWIVNVDYIDNYHGGEYKLREQKKKVSIIGPRGCELTEKELLKGHPFKMYDDDDQLYYTGFLVGDKESEEGFDPLNDYGTPNAGCTKIFYKNEAGEWKEL